MSVVTNVILTTGSGPEYTAIAKLNRAPFVAETALEFMDVGEFGGSFVAGSKNLECGVYLGAFNHLTLADLINSINNAPWEDKEQVQLFIKGENDTRFREIDLFP